MCAFTCTGYWMIKFTIRYDTLHTAFDGIGYDPDLKQFVVN